MQQKPLIVFLILVILVLGLALGYMIIMKGETQPTVQLTVPNASNDNKSVATMPVNENNPSNPAKNKATDQKLANVYTNTEYGFEVTIPDGYSDYKAMVEKDFGEKGVTYIHIIFKTNDPEWKSLVEENRVTHEKFPGYVSVFAFTIWDKPVYEKKMKECGKNPYPGCPTANLGKNDRYVYEAIVGNGGAPKDLDSLWQMLATPDIGNILGFKMLNQ